MNWIWPRRLGIGLVQSIANAISHGLRRRGRPEGCCRALGPSALGRRRWPLGQRRSRTSLEHLQPLGRIVVYARPEVDLYNPLAGILELGGPVVSESGVGPAGKVDFVLVDPLGDDGHGTPLGEPIVEALDLEGGNVVVPLSLRNWRRNGKSIPCCSCNSPSLEDISLPYQFWLT